jgi:RimJ/RimL family protein N-acetyltransferase
MVSVQTARLRLVMPAARHAEAAIGFWTSDRAAARGWAQLPHEAWRSFAAVIGHHALRGFGPLVAELADGTPLGLFGAWHPAGQPEAEIKWTLWDPAFEGRGFAAEAARATRAHAYGTLGWTGAVSYIRPDNARSLALASRLGARPAGTWTTPRGTVVEVWRHPAPSGVAP